LLRLEADFFLELAKQRVLHGLALAHTALRKLPAARARALTKEYLTAVTHQDDADVGSISLRIDPVAHDASITGWHAAEQGKETRCTSFIGQCRVTSRPPTTALLVLLVALAAIVACLGLVAGSTDIGVRPALAALFGDAAEPARTVVMELRAPRLLSAFTIGSLLALAGVLLQALFRNPLADSYVLGVSGGSSVGALFALLVGASLGRAVFSGHRRHVGHLPVLAPGARRRHGPRAAHRRRGGERLRCAGDAGAGAADNGQLRGMMFWLAGDLGWAAHPRIMLAAALLATIVVTIISRPLDVLATGETNAQSLGLDLTRWRIVIVVLAGLLTAGAVIQGGTIGFIGLVIPHLVRLAFGTAAHRVVVPAAALAGGTLLAAADLVARTAAAPRQLPVGAIMALLGVPMFLVLLRRLEGPRAQ
jgi:iron complex transport system permease protein